MRVSVALPSLLWGWGDAFTFVRVCAPVLVPVACWLRGGRGAPVATVARLVGVSARCGARVLTRGVSRVGAWWLSCCRRVVRDVGFVGWLRFCATVVVV